MIGLVIGLVIGSIGGVLLMSLLSITRQRDNEAVIDTLEKYLLCNESAYAWQLWKKVEDAFYRARDD